MLKETLLKFFKLDGLIENVTGYLETRIELMKHEIREEMSDVLASILLYFVVGVFLFVFLLIISVAIAFKISENLGFFYGFAIVAGFYFVVSVVMLIFKDNILTAVDASLRKRLKKRSNYERNGNG